MRTRKLFLGRRARRAWGHRRRPRARADGPHARRSAGHARRDRRLGSRQDGDRAAPPPAAGGAPLDQVTLRAPIPRPGKILAIGLNYADHIEESKEAGVEVPTEQVWFCKQPTSVNDPDGNVELPKVSSMLDYEVELVAVIGRKGRHISREAAPAHVFGYAVGNDFTVRDWQHRTPQWMLGKSFDTHCPFGPAIVTADEVGDPHALGIRCFVNGELRQNSNTRHLVFDLWDQIAHLSQAMTLEPGDLIFTGTPGGIGFGSKPYRPLKVGDVVRCEIDGLGAIENRVVRRSLTSAGLSRRPINPFASRDTDHVEEDHHHLRDHRRRPHPVDVPLPADHAGADHGRGRRRGRGRRGDHPPARPRSGDRQARPEPRAVHGVPAAHQAADRRHPQHHHRRRPGHDDGGASRAGAGREARARLDEHGVVQLRPVRGGRAHPDVQVRLGDARTSRNRGTSSSRTPRPRSSTACARWARTARASSSSATRSAISTTWPISPNAAS